jgi:hypothetical protein
VNTLPATPSELAAVHTSNQLLPLLRTVNPVVAVIGYHTDAGIHLHTCPANTAGAHDFTVTAFGTSDQLAPCCATLPHTTLVDGVCAPDPYVGLRRRGIIGAAADAINVVLRTLTAADPYEHLPHMAAVVSSRQQELGSLYPWLTGLLHTHIDTLRGTDTTSNITSLHYVPYAHRPAGLQHRTLLLIARSKLLLPGTHLLYLLDDAAADDLTNGRLTNGVDDVPAWPLLHGDDADTLLHAAHTLHTVLNDSSWAGEQFHNNIGDIARTVAALHPDIQVADRWQTPASSIN